LKSLKTFVYTAFALVAFAANSLLCRMALGAGDAIDAATFTNIRIASGAAMLLLILKARGNRLAFDFRRNVFSAFLLFLYAIAFSLAYLNLNAATGALILFGSVQTTMILWALASGERPRPAEWLGLLAALGGLIYLVFPGLQAPPIASSLLMITAGAAWGFYTLRGRGATNPLGETTKNFLLAAPFALITNVFMINAAHVSPRGALLAVLSGAVASGVGYVIWYAALGGLTATRAATVQLSVPVITAIGGIALLNEKLSLRLAIAAALILGGIALAVFGRQKTKKPVQ
jgi:drug/metabolite transporter (DMT)-like permease